MTEHRPPYETNDNPPDLSSTLAGINARLDQLAATMQESEQTHLEVIRALLETMTIAMDKLADARRWSWAWKQAAKANRGALLDVDLLAGEAQPCGHPVAAVMPDGWCRWCVELDAIQMYERERCADIATAYAEELVPFRSLIDKGKFAGGHAIAKAIRQEDANA